MKHWKGVLLLLTVSLPIVLLLLIVPPLQSSGETSHLDISVSPRSPWRETVLNEQANGCRVDPDTVPFPDAGDCFVQGLITPTAGITGLVTSLENECFTTVYKNSLAAMAFIHQGEVTRTERIFNFFQSQLTATTPISGFRQAWDPCTSLPLPDNPPTSPNPYWEGDNAFLLLALNHYAQETGGYGNYGDLTTALTQSLTYRADSCAEITAPEGVANIYAALFPFSDDWHNWQALSKLYRCFFNSKDYPGTADHTVRGALVFGDTTGFEHLSNFERTETWQCNENTEVQAYAAFSGVNSINVEISAQLLLAWRLWQHELDTNLSSLRSELEKLRLLSERTSMCSGVPYLVRHPACDRCGFDGDYSLPIIDSTVYLLYDYWNFNPFAPGRQAVCRRDKFIQLIMDDQGEGFPRIFYWERDPFDSFPQEINDSNHRQIVIEFTTLRPLLVPMTLTVDTVARSSSPFTFTMDVKLDDGDHCLDVCDRSGTYTNTGEAGTLLLGTCDRIFLPVIAKNATTETVAQSSVSTSSYTYTYQLVLEGTRGWGVFDWLQLETPDKVLWTIGNKDNQCNEFDNEGFFYSCN